MKFRRQKSFVAAILCASMIMPNCAWAGEVDQANHAVVQETQDTSEEKIFEESSDATESTETIENTETTDAAETEVDTEETEVVPETRDDANEPQTEQTETSEETSDQAETDETDDLISEDQEQKEGLVKEDDGKIYYYENGEKFTDGYKEVTDENGNMTYYYFQEDGSAFTSGLKSVVINGERYGYYFQNNGQAYVNGLLEWKDDDGKVYYYYFQKNGRMYVGGYKGINTRAAADNSGNVTPIDDHTTHYYYLQQNGQAYTGGFLEFVHTNGKTYYYDQNTHQPVTGIQSIDNKLYYFDASGVQQSATFGIDVSKYQSSIDWDKVKTAGVEFAIIRVGYRGYGSGALVQDPKFEEHFTNARNAGLRVGIYCFSQAVNENEAREEAQACVYVLNGRQLDYPIYFDTEASGAGNGRADGLGVVDRTKCAVAFCEEVKALGYKPGVYASTTWFRKRLDMSQLSNYYIWNAHYNVASSPIACNMWQGTCTARIPGYGGQIDVNISYMG